MNIALWIVQIVLGVMFVITGFLKGFQYERAKATLPWPWVKELSRSLVIFIGISEFLGGLGLLLPALTHILPWLTPLAAVGLAIILLLAIIFHARRGEGQGIVVNIVILALALFIAYGRFVVAPL